jgi:signal transduction histidine kinase
MTDLGPGLVPVAPPAGDADPGAEPPMRRRRRDVPVVRGPMLGRPFGVDELGRRIDHGSGRTVAAAVRFLQTYVGERVERESEPGVDPIELRARVERARREAVDRLVSRLNAAIEDERRHVTEAYLLDEGNSYSYEFRLFVAAFAREISGDADFYTDMGRRSIPGSVVSLARPLGVRGTFSILPRLTARFVRTDLRVEGTSRSSARVRWYGGSQLAEIPDPHRRAYVDYACTTYQGTFSAIPTVGWGLPPAEVRELACQLDDEPYCEWEFRWQAPPRRTDLRAIGLAVLGALAMAAYLGLRLPGWEGVALVAAVLLPAALVLYGTGIRRLGKEARQQRELLLEQRETSEREYDRSERVNAQLQLANLALEERVSELMALNELGVALSTTLDLHELLDSALRAVVTHLRFDRALVLLADEAQGVLADGRSVGETAEMTRVISELRLPLDHPHSQLVALYRADGPMLFHDVDQDPHEDNRQLAHALGVTSFLGTPLVAKGRTVGILAVDNRLSGRNVEPGDGPLLFTVGNLIAAAVENSRLYEAVEEQNRDLEDRVHRRTEQLADAVEVAQAARAAAESASAAKSAFLANVSHELRTPLTSVVGFTKLIRRRLAEVVFPAVAGDDPKVSRTMRQVDENLGIMSAEGERLTAMINDVLDLEKIEAGRFEWAMGPLSIGEVIERATAATAALFETTGLSLMTEIDPDLPTVEGDRDRLIQVVINLISNAVKFTPEGGVSIAADRVDGAVQVAVVDTGIGIDPADHDTVWETFRQVGDTLTDKPRGTGLGLPICRQIVEHHGGRMWLESEVGRGSAFIFTIPLQPVAPAVSAGA